MRNVFLCGYQRALLMVFWFFLKQLTSSIRQQIFTRRNTSDAFAGMTQPWPSNGPYLAAVIQFQRKTKKECSLLNSSLVE